MSFNIARTVFGGIVIGVATIAALKGVSSMPAQQKAMAAGTVLPYVDTQQAGPIETATFALG